MHLNSYDTIYSETEGPQQPLISGGAKIEAAVRARTENSLWRTITAPRLTEVHAVAARIINIAGGIQKEAGGRIQQEETGGGKEKGRGVVSQSQLREAEKIGRRGSLPLATAQG